MNLQKITRLCIIIVASLYSEVIFCQQTNVKGSVVGTSGNAVPFATIKDITSNKLGNADSSGHFTILSSGNSSLLITAVGYKDTTVAINNQSDVTVTLSAAPKELSSVSVTGSSPNVQQNELLQRSIVEGELLYSKQNDDILGKRIDFSGAVVNHTTGQLEYFHIVNPGVATRYASNALIPEIHEKEETRGNQFLLNSWAKGLVVINGNNIISNNSYWYNYNKTTGDLIMTEDFKNGLTIDKPTIVYFILFDSAQQQYTFVLIPSISSTHFCKAIVIDSKYDVFKLITTKFVKAQFQNDGIVSNGNPYDEYVDKETYYLLDVASNTYKTFTLKKKSLAGAFNNNADVNAYFGMNKDEINDDYLKKLFAYLDTKK